MGNETPPSSKKSSGWCGWTETLGKWANDPALHYKIIWAIIQILVIGYCGAALGLSYEADTLGAFDFAVVWLLILVIILSVFGTCFMCRKKAGRLHLGIFIGVSAMMSNIMLIISIMSGQDLATRDDNNLPSQEENAVAVLALFCSLAYAILAYLMFKHRKKIVPVWDNFVELTGSKYNDGVTYGEDDNKEEGFDSLNV